MMWATKNADNLLNGYKLNLQQLMGMKIPAGILNFLFKHSYCRKVTNMVPITDKFLLLLFKVHILLLLVDTIYNSYHFRDWQRLKHLDSRDILQKRLRKKAKKIF